MIFEITIRGSSDETEPVSDLGTAIELMAPYFADNIEVEVLMFQPAEDGPLPRKEVS